LNCNSLDAGVAPTAPFPYADLKALDEAMTEIGETAVESLAKRLAETDGFEWQPEWKMPLPDESKRVVRPLLDDAGRERYLAIARQQLNQGLCDA
jgi:hypothetical protein